MIPHGDIVGVMTHDPNQHIVQRGWQNMTPHEDKDDDHDDGDDHDGLGRTCKNPMVSLRYPLVMTNIAIENQHF